jgi:hypothetical protein
LQVRAKSRDRKTFIYLLPGLTAAQHHAALIRIRSNGQMGDGPRLPATSAALAVIAHRMRATVLTGAAATRSHPVLLLLPLIRWQPPPVPG